MFSQYPVNKQLTTYEVETPEFWNDIYDNKIPAWGNEPAEVLKKFLMYFPRGARILDIGCGEGRNSIHLSRLGYTVTGIDISSSAIERARAKDSKCTFYCMDALNDTLKETFDVIIDFGLFHFMPHEYREKYVDNIYSMLVNDGIYINQSGRLTESPIIGNLYTPPQLERQELLDEFKKFTVKHIQEDVLPPYKHYGRYPCWNLLIQKTAEQQ